VAHAPIASTSEPDPGLYPNLLRYGPAMDPDGMDRRFQFGLDRAVEGIKARATRGRRRRR
jgi:hypothetical protein